MKRAALAAVAFAAVLVLPSSASASPPTFTLLTPKNGATIAAPPYSIVNTTFSWRIDWDAPEGATVMWQISSNPSFAPSPDTQENRNCPATNINCFTSYTPQRSYSPPYPKVFYWRVGVTTSAGIVWSPAALFTIVNPPDRTKPRVRAYPGAARRGTQARLRVRAADDRGPVRLKVTIERRGRVFYRGQMGWTATHWSDLLQFRTTTPLPRFFPTGVYLACVRAWDKAGNTARSCAKYRVL
jgi:hypothetical protein